MEGSDDGAGRGAVVTGGSRALITTSPGALTLYKGPVRTRALAPEKVLAGNELTFAEVILLDKYEQAKKHTKVSITDSDYGTLLSRLADQAIKNGADDRYILDNPRLLELLSYQFLNGCLVLNLQREIEPKRIIERLTNTLRRADRQSQRFMPGDIGRLGEDKDTQIEIGKFNVALKKSQQQFLKSPYESLYRTLNVFSEGFLGKKLSKARLGWASFLPILRAELGYLTKKHDENTGMKPYVYYTTKLIHQIASATHDKLSTRTVMGTEDPRHRQFLGSLIDSGTAAYNLRFKYLNQFESSRGDMINQAFSDILTNHLKEFFPAQPSVPSRKLFKHRLNAYIIFALGAYETFTKTLDSFRIKYKIVDKYDFIKEQLHAATERLVSPAEMRRSESGRGYDNPELIWPGFEVPTLSESITLELLQEIQRTLNRRSIQNLDNRYVRPIIMEGSEEKEEQEEEHPPRLAITHGGSVRSSQPKAPSPALVAEESSQSSASPPSPPPPAPPLLSIPIPPPPPESMLPVPPSVPKLPGGSSSASKKPVPPLAEKSPDLLASIRQAALDRAKRNAASPPPAPTKAGGKAAAAAGGGDMLSTLVLRLQARNKTLNPDGDEGKGDSDGEDPDWD